MKKITKWVMDSSRSKFLFMVRHKMSAYVYGKFKSFETNIYTTSNDFKTTQINFWIDVSSIITEDNDQSELLKSSVYLDLEHFELITFVSTNLGEVDSFGAYNLEGYLTVKGISKIINLKIQLVSILTDQRETERARFKITGKINRSDWGIGWNPIIETTGLMLSEEVLLDFELELKNSGKKVLTAECRSECKQSKAALDGQLGTLGKHYSVN